MVDLMTWQMAIHFVLWAIFASVWLLLMPKSRKDERFVRKTNYNGSLWITISLSGAVWFVGWSAINPLFSGQEIVGVMLGVVGLGFAIHARLILGHYWDIHAAGHKEGELLEAFPYNTVRHPIYGAQLLMCAGTGLSSNNLAAFAILVVGTYALLLHRTWHEEALLNELTENAYAERFNHKGRFFPRVIPPRNQ
jgi:protein-S-isoprenylcysteine O-methyltransferase Ste14